MPSVYIKVVLPIQPGLRRRDTNGPFRFRLSRGADLDALHGQPGPPRLTDGAGVEVEIDASGETAVTTGRFDVSSELADALAAQRLIHELPETTRSEYTAVVELLTASVSQVVDFLAQELHAHASQVAPPRIGADEWSADAVRWVPVDGRTLSMTVTARLRPSLDPEFTAGVQALLGAGERALAATYFLHRAHREEEDPRQRWINAAVAAELAVKEVLRRLDAVRAPALMRQLLGQKPPVGVIRALYDAALTELTGTPSPFVEQLRAGAKLRNALVHQPERVRVTHAEATAYVQAVDDAIRDLLQRTRPALRPVPRSASADLVVVAPRRGDIATTPPS